MLSKSYRISGVILLSAFLVAGSIAAQPQHQQHHPQGGQTIPTQSTPPATSNSGQDAHEEEQIQGIMGSMQDMMESMQDMMESMQDMMGRRGVMRQEGMPRMMGRRGMTAQGGMQGKMGCCGMMGQSGMQGMMGRRGMMADDDDHARMAGITPHGMMGHGHIMGHGGMLWRHVERFIEPLDLTEEQRTKVQPLVQARAKDAIRIHAEIATKKVDVHTLLNAEPVDVPKVRELLQSIATQMVDFHIAHLTLMQDINQLLTPEQQQKFRTVRRQMMQGHRGTMGQEFRRP